MLDDNRNFGDLRNGSGSDAGALPEGVLRTKSPFTQHDYTVTDPMNMKAVDDLLLGLVVGQRRQMVDDGVL